MPTTVRKQAICSQKAMMVLNVAAVTLILLAVALAGVVPGLSASDGPGSASWFDLAMAIAGGGMMAGAMIAAVIRGPDEDEYVRRLAAQAAAIGFYATMTAYVIWAPLAGSWLPLPTGDQVMALLFAGTGVGWFIVRARGGW